MPGVPKLDKNRTVKYVATEIVKYFPSMSTLESSGFISRSRQFVEKMINDGDIETLLNSHSKTICSLCIGSENNSLIEWRMEPKNSYMLSLGHLVKIKIPDKCCRRCKCLYYPG